MCREKLMFSYWKYGRPYIYYLNNYTRFTPLEPWIRLTKDDITTGEIVAPWQKIPMASKVIIHLELVLKKIGGY